MKNTSIRNTAWSLLGVAASAMALDNGMALTPPMGWNSWNTFGGSINETLIRGVIDAMVTTGMKDAGYTYVNLDDNWFPNPARDASGNLIADPTRFKSGMKSLSDYAHSKGLKLGIYSDRGSKTCMGIAQSGGYGNEDRDAKSYASWGIDYLKYDNCNTVGQMQSDYTKMSTALKNSGRSIVFSICAWETQPWMPEIGNLWRSTTDIADSWGPTGWSIMGNFDKQVGNYIYTRPGAWSDPDMLEVGRSTKLSDNEYRAHFGLWALVAAPLISGNDIRSMSAATKAILTHPEVIAIDQDSMGVQARKISDNGDLEVFAKPLGKGFDTYAVGLLNRSGSTQNITVNWKDLKLDPKSVTVRDVWNRTDLGSKPDSYTASVQSHALVLLKVKGKMDTTATWWAPDIHFVSTSNGSGVFRHNQSNGGKTITLGGKTHAKGFGVHSPSRTIVPLHRKFARFQVQVGIDAETTGGSAVFQILGNGGAKLYESPVCKGGAAPVSVDISVAGQDSLYLITTDGGDGNTNDHADWASPVLTLPESMSAIQTKARGNAGWSLIAGEGKVSIHRDVATPTMVQVIDAQGRVVLSQVVEGMDAILSTQGLARGVYSLRSQGSNGPALQFVNN